MSRLAFPFRIAASGRSAAVPEGSDAHIKQMLTLLIMTIPEERVMNPDFGSPATQLLFAPGNGPVAAALQATLQAAIMQWLGHLLSLLDLAVTFDEATSALEVDVTYVVLRSKLQDSLQVTRMRT